MVYSRVDSQIKHDGHAKTWNGHGDSYSPYNDHGIAIMEDRVIIHGNHGRYNNVVRMLIIQLC